MVDEATAKKPAQGLSALRSKCDRAYRLACKASRPPAGTLRPVQRATRWLLSKQKQCTPARYSYWRAISSSSLDPQTASSVLLSGGSSPSAQAAVLADTACAPLNPPPAILAPYSTCSSPCKEHATGTMRTPGAAAGDFGAVQRRLRAGGARSGGLGAHQRHQAVSALAAQPTAPVAGVALPPAGRLSASRGTRLQ